MSRGDAGLLARCERCLSERSMRTRLALREGSPYQTLISSILHEFVTGRLVERKWAYRSRRQIAHGRDSRPGRYSAVAMPRRNTSTNVTRTAMSASSGTGEPAPRRTASTKEKAKRSERTSRSEIVSW